ncbi:hypothetical protein [Zhaonella formicivorans]|jgi:hypothetical protein|uniref:hypothetical protein n=1 Tax=Zhaonella formicivorans TaxID=2528593 RepID=UPI0010D6D562|nr:hypothetical protein [Zhaonella formicivorans]
MWWKPILLVILLLFVLTLSLREQIKLRYKSQAKELPQEPVGGLISQALAHLVGVAGGIYLSLIMLTSFLGIAFPESFQILGISLDPLAFISLLIALLQPWLSKLYYSYR